MGSDSFNIWVPQMININTNSMFVFNKYNEDFIDSDCKENYVYVGIPSGRGQEVLKFIKETEMLFV